MAAPASLPSSIRAPAQSTNSSTSSSPYSSISNAVSLRRHYKKDSRFVLDLYTLTFDEDESVDNLATLHTDSNKRKISSRVRTLSVDPGHELRSLDNLQNLDLRQGLKSLRTNLHRILARKICNNEHDLGFQRTKMLTKTYYELLREHDEQLEHEEDHDQADQLGHDVGAKVSWNRLIEADKSELERMCTGLSNAVMALNAYLLEMLELREQLMLQQDKRLEEISLLADQFLSK